MQKSNLAAVAAMLAVSGIKLRMAPSPDRPAMGDMINAADVEAMNQAQEKRQRKAAKRFQDGQKANLK